LSYFVPFPKKSFQKKKRKKRKYRITGKWRERSAISPFRVERRSRNIMRAQRKERPRFTSFLSVSIEKYLQPFLSTIGICFAILEYVVFFRPISNNLIQLTIIFPDNRMNSETFACFRLLSCYVGHYLISSKYASNKCRTIKILHPKRHYCEQGLDIKFLSSRTPLLTSQLNSGIPNEN
jgi:hypothetical protein